MLPYPHRFITPNNIDIDLRLYNHDLQRQIQPILSDLLSNNTSKNGFTTAKRRLINEYKRKLLS
jgi:secreted Zn-dependent insulinase-like peptidase